MRVHVHSSNDEPTCAGIFVDIAYGTPMHEILCGDDVVSVKVFRRVDGESVVTTYERY